MKLIVSDIPDEGIEREINKEILFQNAHKAPVNAHLHFIKDDENVFVSGHLRSEIDQVCSRCLEAYREKIDFDFSATYIPYPERGEHSDKYKINREELEIEFYHNNEIDVFDLIKEQVNINLAMKPLCSEDCKGLCKTCGANLKLNPCHCSKDEVDERWVVLKNFFLKGRSKHG